MHDVQLSNLHLSTTKHVAQARLRAAKVTMAELLDVGAGLCDNVKLKPVGSACHWPAGEAVYDLQSINQSELCSAGVCAQA